MFKTSNSSKLVKSKYDVPKNVEYNEGSLWDVPDAEYLAWNVPQLVLNVLDIEGDVPYDTLKHILHTEGVPTHVGYVWQAIYELENVEIIELKRNPKQSVIVKLKVLDYDDFL